MRARTFVPLLLGFAVPLACGSDPPANNPPDAAVDAPVADAAVDAPPATGPARFVVEHYDVDLDLTSRVASARLRLRVTAAGDCVSIPFRPATADGVTLDTVDARDVAVADGTLTACDPTNRGWAVGNTVTLAATATIPAGVLRGTQVGLSSRRDVAGGTFTYLLSWVGECDRFGPCAVDPSAFATYHFNVTHPSGTRVLCPGTIAPDDTRTECDFAFEGGPSYSTFGVMADQRWVEHSLGRAGKVAVTLYDLPGTDVTASLDAGRVRGMLTFMSGRFGAYPYGDALRLVVGPTTWAGFEHPGNITLAQTLGSGNAEHTAFHEIAHQWAGNQTTLAATRDFVWKESMAEYLSFVYEATQLTAARALTTAATWKDSARGLSQHPVPATDDVALTDYYGSAYGPGPMVLFRQLEVRYSRDAVMGALQDLLGRPRAISLDDVRRALEARTGANLAGYVSGWLVGTGAPTWPTARVDRNTAAGGPVTITVNPHGKGRGLLFVVRLGGAGGETLDVTVDTGIDGSGSLTTTARPGFVVTTVTLDPEAQALVFDEPAAGAQMLVRAPARPWLAP